MSETSSQRNKGYIIPVKVLLQAKEFGLELQDLTDMLNRSARTTHHQGNRRFHEYVFRVEGSRVQSIFQMSKEEMKAERNKTFAAEEPVDPAPREEYYKCETCRDTGRMVVFDECEACRGVGCRHCDEGLVRREVRCPNCAPQTIGVWHDKPSRGKYNRR